MYGKCTGLQERFKKDFPLIYNEPCSVHSLNLIGSRAAEWQHSAMSFFGMIQTLYNFFVASTHRWQLLNEKIFSKECKLTLKSLSETRRSVNIGAVKALQKKIMQLSLNFLMKYPIRLMKMLQQSMMLKYCTPKCQILKSALLIFVD